MELLIALTLLLAPHSYAQNEDIEDLFVDENPPIFKPINPYKLKKQEPKFITVDEYCLCQCIKKGEDPKKARVFKGTKTNSSCLCQCAK